MQIAAAAWIEGINCHRKISASMRIPSAIPQNEENIINNANQKTREKKGNENSFFSKLLFDAQVRELFCCCECYNVIAFSSCDSSFNSFFICISMFVKYSPRKAFVSESIPKSLATRPNV